MTHQRLNEIMEEQLDTCRTLLSVKGDEYAEGFDRLDAFKKAAKIQGVTPRQALCGMMAKHTVSIYDMAMSGKDYSDAKWAEKITDSINYLILLKGVIEDERLDRTEIQSANCFISG